MRGFRMLPVFVTIVSALLVGSTMRATQPGTTRASSAGVPCSVTVADRAGDAITSDGQGPYTDGVAGIDCTVYQGASDDATLYFTASGKKAVRSLRFDYTAKISGPGPTSVLNDYMTLSSFQMMASMGVGATEWHTGGFTTGVGRFAFNPANWPGAAMLVITRTSATDWTVTADAGLNDIAVLLQTSKNRTVNVGAYHMPFELNVHCPPCS